MIFKSKKKSSQNAYIKTTERTFRQCYNNCLVQNDTSARVTFVPHNMCINCLHKASDLSNHKNNENHFRNTIRHKQLLLLLYGFVIIITLV